MNRHMLGEHGIGQEKLQELLFRLIPELQVLLNGKLQRVILYGSYARGEEDRESDLDIMVLVNEQPEALKQLHDPLVDLCVEFSLEYGLVISIRLKNCMDFDNYVQYVPFYQNVEREGIPLYG